MRTDIVFTLTGPDRVGIVEDVTGIFLNLGGNVETSRMARLGGEFAMLMLVSLPLDRVDSVSDAFAPMTADGYHVHHSATKGDGNKSGGWRPFAIEVSGADHEGIIHDIAAGLSAQGISIESMETSASRAPLSGVPLFTMRGVVVVPPALAGDEWSDSLAEAAHHANVDVTVTPA